MVIGTGTTTEFNFPTDGVDVFNPPLINDVTVVNADHVIDLRLAVCAIENLLVGVTDGYFSYGTTTIVGDGYNVRDAIEALDIHVTALGDQIGFTFTGLDGYAGRIDSIEFGLNSHRIENSSVDIDGYSVHGVEGFVVGTQNIQPLINKILDSGHTFFGPKLIARAPFGDTDNQIEVRGIDGYTLVSSINWRGDAYFAGDIIVEGDRLIKGMDVIQNSLTVDGSSILGDNTTLDTTTINGSLTINGTSKTFNVANTGDITSSGANATLGDDTGILDLDYVQVDLSQDLYVKENLTVDGSTILGNGTGDNHTIRGSLLHTLGVLHSSGEFRALGTKFRVESDTTTIETSDFIVTSANSQLGETLLQSNGNITSDGYLYQFGNPSTTSTNTFTINANTLIEDLIVTNDIQVSAGQITTPSLETSNILLTGPLRIADGSEGNTRYVWTSTDTLGNGEWAPALRTPWVSVMVDGYTVSDAYGLNPLTPLGSYDALPGQEIFVQTDAYGSFTINLPSNPIIGDRVRFIDHSGGWSSINKALVFPQDSGVVKTFVDGDVNTVNDRITIPLHGLITGQRGVLSTSGTLPSGLGIGPFVYVIGIDVNTIQFASTLDNAIATSPIPIDITLATGGGTHTFTSGTIQGSGFLELDVSGDWAELSFNGTSWRVLTS